MSITEQYYEAIADYGGVEGDVKFLRVEKVDVVRLIKKKHKYLKSSGLLTNYKHGIHFSQQYDELTYQIRHSSKICLRQNHFQIIISENKASNVSIRINAAQMYRLTIGKLCILNLQDALQIMGRHLE
ncbi:MAG: hypothetical protein EZS28_012155 [Streblomastix strix]|uniref:Uncharacterized protein n=1 Tax=Streblomastix strix TaxID=222440 RepID=A0A5J4WDA0_9EUKA|nr:MAG: hypothetical protein EZS28_012155 [Streblomastix strix]